MDDPLKGPFCENGYCASMLSSWADNAVSCSCNMLGLARLMCLLQDQKSAEVSAGMGCTFTFWITQAQRETVTCLPWTT